MMTRPGRWLWRWPGTERPDRRSFPRSGVRAAILVPRSVVDPLGIGQRCGPAQAPLGRISWRENVLAYSPFAPLGPLGQGLGEIGWAQDGMTAARGERQRAVGVAREQIRSCRLHRVSSSRRCSPPLLSPRGVLHPAFGRIAHMDGRPSAAVPPSPPRPAFWRSGPDAASLGRASPPSSPSAPRMRCPGSGLQRSRRSRPRSLAPASAIAWDRASSAPGRRWRSCLRGDGNRAGVPVPRRGRLYPYKGTRGARTVSARRGRVSEELPGSAGQTFWS